MDLDNHCLFVSYLISVAFRYGWISDTKFQNFSEKDWIWIFKKFSDMDQESKNQYPLTSVPHFTNSRRPSTVLLLLSFERVLLSTASSPRYQRWARIRTGSDWIRTEANFWPDQDWIRLTKFFLYLCDYFEHIKNFSCDPILQIC